MLLSVAPLAALGSQETELSIKPESVFAMVRALRRELAPMTGVRSQLLAAVRADSGTPRADQAFLRFDAAGADTLRAHLPNLKFALDPISLWLDSSVLAPLRQTFTSYGIRLEIAEADANPVMSDSASRAGVGRFLTRPMRALLDIRVKEQLEPIGGDGAISVPLDEIGRRIAATDRVRAMATKFAGSEELERRRGAYLNAFSAAGRTARSATTESSLRTFVRAWNGFMPPIRTRTPDGSLGSTWRCCVRRIGAGQPTLTRSFNA